MFEQEMQVADDDDDADDDAGDDDSDAGHAKLLLSIQTGVTLVFGPIASFFLLSVLGDLLITSPHLHGRDAYPPMYGSTLQFVNLVVFPALSFFMASYMMVAFWMDRSGWTMLRRCVMFSTIPMIIFYGLILMGQSNVHTFGTSCAFRAFLLQIVSWLPSSAPWVIR